MKWSLAHVLMFSAARPATHSVQGGLTIHLLVDLENLQPTADEVSAFIGSGGRAWVFHGLNQYKLLPAFQALGEQVTLVPISRTGPNALDFHLVFYLGHLTSKFSASEFLVLSRDTGFDPMIEHARMLMFSVRRVVSLGAQQAGAPITVPAVKKAPPAKTAAAAMKAPGKKKVAPAKAPAPAAKKAAGSKPAPAKTPAVKTKKPKTAEAVAKEVLKGLTAKNRPAKLKGLEHLIESQFGGKATPGQLQDVLGRLVSAGAVSVDQGKLSYPAS